MLHAIAGFCYGAALAALGLLAAGAGHGTYIPMGISSAPLGLFGFLSAGLGAPVLWGCVAMLLAAGRRRLTGGVVIAHYAGAVVLASHGAFGDWAYLNRSIRPLGVLITVWTLIYVIGQLVLWRALLGRSHGAS